MQQPHLITIAVSILASAAAIPAQAQDAAHGESVFRACAVCHAKDHSNRAGPGLQGIVGRTAGMSSGFHYSRAMKQSKIVWDGQTLDAYIAAPQKVVPGNVMPYAGMKDAQDRADLIAYLETLK
jgi:cytochrome c